MSLYALRAVANGVRTDHPVPGLPFVDDSHIPLDDPAAIEATGRHPGTDMWGREDHIRGGRGGGWAAFTTDPVRHDLAWCVRWHPEHGRSVLLYRDDDAAAAHTEWDGPALLFRAGGYWWDGTTWYRPSQVWDAAGEEYYRRPVPAAVTVTAADPGTAGDPAQGQVLEIGGLDPDSVPATSWADDLARWAASRGDGVPLSGSVVNLSAPELTGDQLIGAGELARIGGVAASTLRAYISRGESGVPAPQATISGRAAWSRPVAEEWAEQRRRSSDGAAAAVSTDRVGAPVAPGIADVWERFTRAFTGALWDNPGRRRRWALRWRTRDAVHDIARDLGWYVAADIGTIIPAGDLAATIRQAIVDELATGQQLDRDNPDPVMYGIMPPVARMLDWLIRHDPGTARYTIGQIIGEAERRLGIPRTVTEHSLRIALALDSKLDRDTLTAYLDRVLSPDDPAAAGPPATLTLVKPPAPGSPA